MDEERLMPVAVVILQRVIGVTTDAPTGDPAQLIGQCFFQGDAELLWFVLPGFCVGGGVGGDAWEGVAPGVEAFDCLLTNHKL
ncbi:hypothetical protein D3C76_1726740 [compost metagenome]